jgi:hypothetical protein
LTRLYSLQFQYSPWRGMLIKDNVGDWGICVAAWKGMVPGRPGVRGKSCGTMFGLHFVRNSLLGPIS